MRSLTLVFIMLISCQPMLKLSEERVKDRFIFHDITGSKKSKNANLFITFNSFDEYIVSKYINTRYYYGHIIKSSGFYELSGNTLFLTDEKSGLTVYYFTQFFADHTWLDPVNRMSANYFQGAWLNVPLITEFGIKDKYVPRPPIIRPRPMEPVVIDRSPSQPPANDHKKRPERPEIKRPQRPDHNKPEKAKSPKKRPVRIIT